MTAWMESLAVVALIYLFVYWLLVRDERPRRRRWTHGKVRR